MASTLAEVDDDNVKKVLTQAAIQKDRPGSDRYQLRHMAEIFQENLSFSGFERNRVYFGRRDGTYLDLSDLSAADSEGDCRAVAVADFDDDGDPDIFVTAIQRECHMLFENQVAENHFVKVRLEAQSGHPSAIGAIVKVKAAGSWQSQVLSSGSGFVSQSAPELIFGLGKNSVAEVRVRWPGRSEENFGPVKGGDRLLLVEGSGKPAGYSPRTFRFPRPGLRGLRIDVGDILPPLSLKDVEDNDTVLTKVGDKPLLLNFWQTTCRACLQELPLLEKIHEAGQIRVKAVCLDEPNVIPRILDLWKKQGLSFPSFLLSAKSAERLFDLNRLSIPVSVLVSPDGTITRILQGKIPDGVFESL